MNNTKILTTVLMLMFLMGVSTASGTNFSDNFNRSDSTTLGNGWTEVAGDLKILSNEVRNEAIQTYHTVIQDSLSGSSQDVSCDFARTTSNGGPWFGVILRYQDSQNYYWFYRKTGGTARVYIGKMVNGTLTELANTSMSNPSVNTYFTLQGIADGTTLKLKVDGVEKLSITDSTFSSGKVGIRFGPTSNTDSHKADNFSVTLDAPPDANFTGSPTSGDYPLTVNFTDTSTGMISAWNWSFGDTGTSTAQNPSHNYTGAGLYTVSLTVSGAGGSDSLTRTDYITVTVPQPQPPSAAFSGTPLSGAYPLAVTFTDASTGEITAWDWDFGDTEVSNLQNPSHTYNYAGTFTVSLTVTGSLGEDTETKVGYVAVTEPTAPFCDWYGSPRSGSQPLTVNFHDTSTGTVTAWNWSFGDGGSDTIKHPSHQYANAGLYTVSLTVSSSAGSDTRERPDYITVNPPAPVANFSGTPTSGDKPLTVNFTDTSTNNPTSWSWTFGDTGTSTAKNPSHQYTVAGTYTVSLTATNSSGSDNETKTNYITVTNPGGQESWTTYNNSNTGGAIGNNTINDVGAESGGVRWICTNGGGVAKYDGTTWTKYTTSAGLANNTVRHVAFDSSSNKWFATSGGVSKYTGSSWTKYTSGNSGLAGNNCYAIAAENTTIWVGTYDKGACKFNGSSWQTYNTSNSGIAGNRIEDVAVDSSGVKWFATMNGVSKYDGTTWTTYANQLASDDVFAAAVAPNGDKWFGTLSGVSRFTGTSWTTYTTSQGLAENDHRAMAVGSNGIVWGGSNGSGADKFAGSTPWTVYDTSNSGLVNNVVNGIAAEGSYKIWFGTNAGVSLFDLPAPPAPVAAFSGVPTAGSSPLTVNFTDTSTNEVTSWSWTFGDTGTSTAQNPSHQYTANGTYTVSLTVNGPGGSDVETKTNYIIVAAVPPAPVANFSGSPTSGNKPLTVNFTDSSTGAYSSWSWTFGDSGTSTVQNPSHQYQNSGSYTVSLTVSGLGGSDVETKTNYIVVSQPAPVAAFTGSPTSGDKPLTVTFTDQSTGSPTAWSWSFGDTGTSTAQNPSHQYNTAGNYTVTLTASNPGGSDAETKVDYITVTNPIPVPDFEGSPTSGLAPLQVTFVDKSTGLIDTWKWDFNGDGSIDWSKSNPTVPPYTYQNAGVYDVTLNVRDDITGHWYVKTRPGYISVRAPVLPDANFMASKTSGAVPMSVKFTDLSTGDNLSGWSWTFGDSGTSTAQNPTYVYNSAGTYSVSLTASSAYGSDIMTKTNYIVVAPPQPCDANFVGDPTVGFAALTVNFTDLSDGSVTSWSWNFGDSGTSTQQNPSHTYNLPGTYSVTLSITGPLNSDSITKTDYIKADIAPTGGSGLSFVDSAGDLSNLHPHLWCKGYGTENGLWAKAQTTHSEIWERLTRTAPTGATFPGITRSLHYTQKSAMAYVISKITGYGQYAQDEVLKLNGHDFIQGGDDDGIGNMETFWGYCMAYDGIVDDPAHGGPTWLSSSDKASALATMADYVLELNFDPGDTWRTRPTHNFMVCRAGCHAAGLYNLRGESGYEATFNTSREFDLIYHNERINGLCDHGVLGTTAPLSNNGPRPADGFPYEGPSYGAYQGSRALIHRHIMELNEYPNPATVLDENKSGFAQNFNLGWMAVATPNLDDWTRVCYYGDHGITQAFRYHAAINKAVGVSDTAMFPAGKLARVGEWFIRQVIPSPKGQPDQGWWQGFEMLWYDSSIEPMTPAEAGIPLYLHLDDSEFHMYRDSWNIYPNTSEDTYVWLRNSGHDGHNYWNEKQSGTEVPYVCQAQTSSHDGSDNGHFGILRSREDLVENDAPAGNSDRHNCLLIDGVGNLMDNKRGYEVPELGTADCTGAVDSDYGHIIEAVMGGIYQPVTNYSRYMFVIRNKMYVITVDELDSGHTSDFRVFPGINTAKQSSDLYTNSMTRFELIYPSSGYTSSEASHPIDITTSSNKIMFLTHPNPSGVSFSKSYPGNLAKLTVGSDTIIYNPTGGSYSESGISGNAKLFAQRTGGAIICKATSATGSQYGLSCSAATSMSVSGRKAQIFVYGTGNYTVTVTSPYGTDAFANVPAGQTVSKVLTGLGTAPPVADFIAVPTEGWNTYVAPEFVSFSTGWITDYLWEFGDGEWSTDLAPHHKYVSAGLYSIKLTVAGPGGTSSMTKEKYITIKDFGNYSWPDYVLTQPDFAVFTSALQSIEASQTQFYTEKPEWCHNGSWTPWCDVVTSLCGHGGGGRILFGFSNTTVYGNWDGRIDPIKTWGDSNNKYDFIGDNLIIDGQDKNVGFYYNGTLDCGQAENQQAFRLHGVDNIVKNIRWERFPDGIHMRHGMRMLMEGVNNSVVCEDTMTANGVSGSCVACTSRNCTFGASTDKTFMNSTAEGWRGLAPSLLVISGMHSTDGTQPIRVGSDDKSSMTIVRNSTFLGNSAGPRFGGNQSTIIFENNYSSTQKGNDGGLRIGEQVRCIVRHNTLENCGGYGIWCHGTGAYARIENNIITGNDKDGVEALGESSYDLGGGSVEVFWTKNPASMYGIGPGGTAAPSCGRNTITGNGLYDLRNGIDGTPQPEVKAENNFWDHSTVSEVLSSDVSGNVDVDPLGVNIN